MPDNSELLDMIGKLEARVQRLEGHKLGDCYQCSKGVYEIDGVLGGRDSNQVWSILCSACEEEASND